MTVDYTVNMNNEDIYDGKKIQLGINENISKIFIPENDGNINYYDINNK